MPKSPCPIKGCTANFISKDGLRAHLFDHHRKSEVIETFLNLYICGTLKKDQKKVP